MLFPSHRYRHKMSPARKAKTFPCVAAKLPERPLNTRLIALTARLWIPSMERYLLFQAAHPSAGGRVCNSQENLEGFADQSFGKCQFSGGRHIRPADSDRKSDSRLLVQVTGCCNKVSSKHLVRPAVKIPFMAVCEVHRKRLQLHQICPGCGQFCSQVQLLCCENNTDVSRFHFATS